MEDMTDEEKQEWAAFQAIGYELVRQYYTVLTNAPEHLWRFYGKHAQYCLVDEYGTATVATGRPQLRQMFANNRPSSPSDVVLQLQSVHVIRCGPTDDRMLVTATADDFVQTFVAELTSPWSWTVVASLVRNFQTPAAYTAASSAVVATAEPSRVIHSAPVRKSISVDNQQLFVGQLSDDTRSQDLRNTFAKYGRVIYARVMRGVNRCGNRTSNYAFIRFQRQAAVDAALADRPITLCNGQSVNVNRFKVTMAAAVD